jgi:hypothetical protein
MNGSISEFELGVLRSRMLDAARSKARRGHSGVGQNGHFIRRLLGWTAQRHLVPKLSFQTPTLNARSIMQLLFKYLETLEVDSRW